jgi:hypothetical protein
MPPASLSVVLAPETGYGSPVASSARTSKRSTSPGGPVPDGRHHVLIPISVVSCAILLYGLHAPFSVVLVVAASFLTLYLSAPSMVARSRESFDRDALSIRASKEDVAPAERGRRLGVRLDAAWALRWLGAPADMHARRAMVAEEASRPAEAREHYRRALGAWDGELPLPMLLGYANASYLSGDDVEAVVTFQKVLDRGSMLPRVHVRIAHATLRAGLPTDNVEGWLEAAERDAEDDVAKHEVTLVRALGAARGGDRARARELMASVPDDLHPALRAEVRASLDTKKKSNGDPALSGDSTPPPRPRA